MASTAAKAKRKAEAINRLDDLAVQVAEHFGVEVPDLRITNRDPELAQIQQIEATNELLASVLTASGVEVAEANVEPVDETPAEEEVEPEKKSSKKKRTTRRKK